jgi:diguanylate cyclase (GGDEF)-like protein/PAS domain S-box-containing protein
MRNLLASSDERVFFKDRESRFLLVSAGFVAELGQGRSLSDVIGCTDFDIFSSEHASQALADELEIMRTGKPMVGKLERETFHDCPDRWVSTTKWPLRDDAGEIIGTFGISRDVTGQVEAQHQLAWQALHDPLTNLANRVALMDRLAQGLVALERQPGRIALLFVDLDDFKYINDSLGHDAGDHVLREVGRRFQRVARRTDTVARLGGDEFVLLCTALGKDDDLRLIGDRVMQALREPLPGADALTLTGSLGAVATSDPSADPGELLQQADFAMYAAKRAGRDRLELYDPAMHGLAASNRGLVSELPAAVDAGQLFLLYQPVYRIDDGTLVGVEAPSAVAPPTPPSGRRPCGRSGPPPSCASRWCAWSTAPAAEARSRRSRTWASPTCPRCPAGRPSWRTSPPSRWWPPRSGRWRVWAPPGWWRPTSP